MTRPRRCRRIRGRANFNLFKPAGIRAQELEHIILTKEEFEAIRLKDYENFDQIKCSEMMEISQPTFHRLINEARKKLSKAIIEGKAINIEN